MQRFDIYEVVDDHHRGGQRQWKWTGTTDTKEGIGTALVQWADDRDEATGSYPVPVYAIFDNATERWLAGPVPPRSWSAAVPQALDDGVVVAIREDGSYRVESDEDAYDPSDPKHPRFHSTHADIWDARAGK